MSTPRDDRPAAPEQPHATPIEALYETLESSAAGLSATEAAQRLERHGPNQLPQPRPTHPLRRFLRHFHDVLIYVLLVAAVATAAMGHWIDTAVIAAVAVINAVIGFLQEGRAEQALAGLRKMLAPHAHVLRDGAWQEIDAGLLVPGDTVRLRSGDRVPADIRLAEVTQLRIEESVLTGESQPVTKTTGSAAPEAGVGDRRGMAFSGTMVTAGRGVGLVVATGSETELGSINRLLGEVEKLATPLTRQMQRFGHRLSLVIVVLAAAMALVGRLAHGYGRTELFMAAIGFAVAAIPEGLPAILTITLALGVQRMARRNAITRRLQAVETLGSVTVICSDKTGTLTRNEMTVEQVATRAASYRVEGAGYEPEGRVLPDGTEEPATLDRPDLAALTEVMALCNDSNLVQRDGQWAVLGEPTEGALCSLARKLDWSGEGYERLAVIPFESENKWMATLHLRPDGNRRILLKGAPDRLIERCDTELTPDGQTAPVDAAFWLEQVEQLGASGLRVLAAAWRDAPSAQDELTAEDIAAGMTFIGLVGILDPPRPEAVQAVEVCHRAGIRVLMITGDHAGTASAIGAALGIGNGQTAVVGAELEDATDERLQQIVREKEIFARTSPEHKLRLVKALQANGEVVAMTGDGVNDAPALKRADVGVAMGIKGAEATKEAADIVLADDNFTSIEHAVEEGRTIYDNLRKAILFILPTNGAEALVILAAVAVGMAELPLTPVQILWVNMVTAVTLALALAFEPAEPGLMDRPPRAPGTPILGGSFLFRIGWVSLLLGGATIGVFALELHLGLPIELARTVAVNTLVCGQAFYLFNSRALLASSLSRHGLVANPAAWLAVGALAILQVLFVYLPPLQRAFGTAPLAGRHWLVPLGIGLGLFLLVEAEKAVRRRRA